EYSSHNTFVRYNRSPQRSKRGWASATAFTVGRLGNRAVNTPSGSVNSVGVDQPKYRHAASAASTAPMPRTPTNRSALLVGLLADGFADSYPPLPTPDEGPLSAANSAWQDWQRIGPAAASFGVGRGASHFGQRRGIGMEDLSTARGSRALGTG